MNLFRKFSLLVILLALCGAMAGTLWQATPAYALCTTPLEEGEWVNYDTTTRSITRINMLFVCRDTVSIGIDEDGNPVYPARQPSWYLSLFGSCHPTDCEWGEHGAEERSDGWITTTIDHGYAKRYVWVQRYDGDWLRVYIWTDFTDPDRTDYASDDWFVRR